MLTPLRSSLCTAALAVVALTGCATSLQAKTPEEITVARSQERWNAVLKADQKKVYTYLSPETRKNLTEEDYLKQARATAAHQAKALRADCEAAECTVVVELTAKTGRRDLPPEITTAYRERWVREAGQWWFKP